MTPDELKAYYKGYFDGYKAKEYDREGDCKGCVYRAVPERCEGCCRNYADGYVAKKMDWK